MHVLVAQVPWLTPTIRAALDDSRELWVETDVEDRTAVHRAVAQRAVDPAYDLSARLPPGDWAMLGTLLKSCGVGPDRVTHMRPWAANMVLAACGVTRSAGGGGGGQIPASATPDLYLVSTARASGMPVHGFESLDQQVAAMADAPDADQLAMLQRAMEAAVAAQAAPTPELQARSRDAAAIMTGLVRSWYLGDVDSLSRQVTTAAQIGGPAIYRTVYTVRNERFAAAIAQLLGRPTVAFVAIGAGHFVGPDSVLVRLKARGFSAERLE